MFEGKTSNSKAAADQRMYADDERISLSLLQRLEKKFDNMTMAFLQMDTRLAEFGSKISKLELDVNELSTIMKRNAEQVHKFKVRYLNLLFLDKIASPVRTGDEIKAVGGDYLKVALVDETGKLVDSGPESSAEMQIFALKGYVNDENEGDSGICSGDTAIATGRERKTKKAAILGGDVQLKLNKGIGILTNIKFNSSPSHVSGMFKIGARIVDSFGSGIVVQDAKTAPFRVKDYRGKYTEKHHPPCLSDEVWRLDYIGRGGSIHIRLKNDNLDTVEAFLIQLLKNFEGLKEIVNLPEKKWDATVKHALTCQLDEKMYCSIPSGENSGIVFNAVGKVLGLIVESKYLPMEKLPHEQKVYVSKLDVAAFVHKNGLNPFPDEASVLQHFPKQAEPLNPSQLTMSEIAMDHEEEVAESAESQQMTNTVTHYQDVPSSSSHPLEIDEYFGEHYIESLLADCDYNQNTSFSDLLLQESPVVVPDNEVKKKLLFFLTITKWFLNYEKMATAASCCDGNDNFKRRRIS